LSTPDVRPKPRAIFSCPGLTDFPDFGPKPSKSHESAGIDVNFRVLDCVYCDVPLDGRRTQGGRPSRFCGEGCKIAAEAEMRRLTFLLRRFEEGAGIERLRPCGEVRPERRRLINDYRARFDHLAGVPMAKQVPDACGEGSD
jgi:hypothetical protein